MLNLGILASGNLGFETLKKIHEEYTVSFIMTDSSSHKIIEFCKEKNISCFKGNPRNGSAIEFLETRSVEVIISINYLFLVEQDVINHASKLIFNIHGSLLPKYRGRTPHVWAIINGETEVGITAHKVELGCDTGDIIEQIKIPVTNNNTGAEILEIYETLYYPLINKVLKKIISNRLEFNKQDETEATYFGKRTPKDGLIKWTWDVERIRNWVRAQAAPYPGAFTYFNNNKLIIDKAFRVEYFNNEYKIGEIVSIDPLIVCCNGGFLELTLRENITIPLGSVLKS